MDLNNMEDAINDALTSAIKEAAEVMYENAAASAEEGITLEKEIEETAHGAKAIIKATGAQAVFTELGWGMKGALALPEALKGNIHFSQGLTGAEPKPYLYPAFSRSTGKAVEITASAIKGALKYAGN